MHLVKEGLFNVIYSPDIITTGYLIPVELGELEIKKVLGTQTPNPITNFYMTQLDDESFAPFLPDETWDFALSATDGGPSAYEKFLYAVLSERRIDFDQEILSADENQGISEEEKQHLLNYELTFSDKSEFVMDGALRLYLGISVKWDETEIVNCLYSHESKTELTQQKLDSVTTAPNLSAESSDQESFSQILSDSTFLKFADWISVVVILILVLANIFTPKVYVPVQPNQAGQSQNR